MDAVSGRMRGVGSVDPAFAGVTARSRFHGGGIALGVRA